MDPLQIPIPNLISLSKVTQMSVPNSPRRHIHSSFPFYFYSTPSTPNSAGFSAFVAACESRRSDFSSITTNSNFEEPKFKPKKSTRSVARESELNQLNKSISFKCSPVSLTTANVLFRNGKLLPAEPITPSPLRLPPRLQHIENIRKSLRSTQSFDYRRAHYDCKTSDRFDPFVAAVETIQKEDVPWCQILNRHRKVKSFEHAWLDVDPIWDVDDAYSVETKKVVKKGGGEETPSGGEWRKAKKRTGILSYFNKGATKEYKLVNQKENEHESTRLDPILEGKSCSEGCKKVNKRSTFYNYIKSVTSNGKEKRQNEPNGDRTLVHCKNNNNNQQTLLACLGWGA